MKFKLEQVLFDFMEKQLSVPNEGNILFTVEKENQSDFHMQVNNTRLAVRDKTFIMILLTMNAVSDNNAAAAARFVWVLKYAT